MIAYTGHPFIDVGVAVIVAHGKKQRPEDLTTDDLEATAEYMIDIYCRLKPLQNMLSVIFPNSHLTQPAKSFEQKQEYLRDILLRFRDGSSIIDGGRCAFFSELPATLIATREHMPLLNGRETVNFSAMGVPGVPMSGLALLAIHAMPLGCYKCGHLLAFHQLTVPGDSRAGHMNVVLAREAFRQYQQAIALMIAGDDDAQLPNYGSYVRTRYVEQLLSAAQASRDRRSDMRNITGYYFTNYGPKPSLEILRLDNSVLSFISAAQLDHADAWARAVRANWLVPKKAEPGSQPENWRNRLYEALFGLPANALTVMRLIMRGRSWNLLVLFLERVMRMHQERIDTYRALGDRLTEYMRQFEAGSPSFYYRFSRAKQEGILRSVIKSAAERMLKAKTDTPLFTYDEFVMAFYHPSDTYSQWRLARDLISFRILENLHQSPDQFDLSGLPEEDDEPESEAIGD